jgi:CRISPR-associated endonuclease Csn1
MAAGRADYIGWLVTGDELLLDMSAQTSGAIADLLGVYPNTNRWSVDGLFAKAKLRLRPKLLSAEGLPDGALPTIGAIIGGPGWQPSISVVFDKCRGTVVRRNVLGVPRLQSSVGLPTCWQSVLPSH